MIHKEFFQTPWNEIAGRRGGGCYGKRACDHTAHFDQSPFRICQLIQDANRMRLKETASFRHVSPPAYTPEQFDAELRFQPGDLR